MNRYLTDYNTWKNIQLNEAWGPGRTKQTAGMGQKVVGIPIDAQNFKVKIIRDLRVIEQGKLSEANWKSILQWLKAQHKWPQFYPALNDMTNYMVVYSVKADTDRKQVITFTISQKAEGLPEDRSAFQADELKTLMTDQNQATLLANRVNQAEQTKTDATVAAGKFESIPFEKVKTLKSDDSRFKLVKSFFIKMLKNEDFKAFKATREAALIKSEIKAGQLGDASILLLKAMVAGFGLKDEFGDPSEVLDQQLIDGISAVVNNKTNESLRIYETAPKFNIDAFMAAFTGKKTGETNKLDITIPEGGLVKGEVARGDETLKKIQRLIINKYQGVLGKNKLFKKFMAYGADGAYGPTTERIISGVKAALEMSDTDGTTITQELVDKIQSEAIVENLVYLHPMGYIVEQFSVSTFASVTSTSGPSVNKETESKTKPKKDTKTNVDSDASEVDESAFDEIDEGISAAHQKIVDLYNDEEFFKEYKGFWNDDERAAVKEIFGKDYEDNSTWWYSQIRKKYLIPAFNKLKNLEANEKVDQERVSHYKQQIQKFRKLWAVLRKKTLGGTSNDKHVWSYRQLDGTKKVYKVDTDF